MLVEFINKPDQYDNNRDYVSHIKGLAESVFQAEKLGPIGYLQSNSDNFRHTRHKQLNPIKSIYKVLPSVLEEKQFIHKCVSTNGLGPYEQAVLANILNSEYSTIAITGALGSGKSSIVRYILNYLNDNIIHVNCNNYKNCNSHDSIYILVDFLKGFNSKESDKILAEFEGVLYDKFAHVIRQLFSDKKLIDEFVSSATDYGNNILIPFEFIGLKIKQTNNWTAFSPVEQVELILDWVHNRFGSEFPLSFKNSVLAEMINFVGLKFPERLNGCFIILYDNIDRFNDEVQNDLINKLLGISKIIEAKTIICSRLTTFGKISGNSSYAFGVIENAGHLPISIIEKRIEYYLDNRNTYDKYISLRSVIPDNYLQAFDRRLEYVNSILKSKKKDRLYNVISSLSGLSIRRGLHLAKRLVINHVTDYSINPEEDLLISGILCSDNPNCQMKYDDRRVSNIFLSSATLKNSLINIRILNILFVYKTNNKPIRVRELFHYLDLYGIKEKSEIFNSINMLIGIRKRLIYINGISELDEDRFFIDSAVLDSFVQLTWAGDMYYTSLCENLQYLQDCFAIISWTKFNINGEDEKIEQFINSIKSDENSELSHAAIDFMHTNLKNNLLGDISEIIPIEVDSSNFIERIKFLRKGLYIYLYEDIFQSIVYQRNVHNPDNLYKNNTLLSINRISTIDVISKVSMSVLKITKSKFNEDKAIYEELLNWKNLVQILTNWNYAIFRTSNNLSRRILNAYNEI